MPFVRRPGRYIGGEINQIKKDLSRCDVKVALCFPDIYEIAMSHTGLAILYHILNQMESVAAERVFAPWTDAEQILRQEKIPLFTLESMAAVADFDIVGFSLTNELCYTNMLNMLDLAAIPLRASQRSDHHPLIIAGGQASNSAEPIAEFIDLFVLGEAEEAIVKLIDLFKAQKEKGATKQQFLNQAARCFNFVYVPSLYKFEYDGEKIKSFHPLSPDLPMRFENAIVENLDTAPVPTKPIVPFVEAVHERISIEIMRGCPGRCRFCQASFCRRPVRYRGIDKIVDLAKQIYHATGLDTVGLLSLSSADYPDIEQLVLTLQQYFQPRHVGVSMPSLKVQQQLKLLPKLITSVRKGGLTIAVEAADERLRKIINKPISDEDLFAGASAAFNAGFKKVKLYFMTGLPGETHDDIVKIVDLSEKIARLRKKVDNKVADVNITVSWLIPKPHTPFGWLSQKQKQYFEQAKTLILQRKRKLNARFLRFKFHNIESSILETCLARGDRRTADIIETAFSLGAKFDLWSECFDYSIWRQAFAAHGADPEQIAQRSFDTDEILPWSHLGGPTKKTLLRHLNDTVTLQSESDISAG